MGPDAASLTPGAHSADSAAAGQKKKSCTSRNSRVWHFPLRSFRPGKSIRAVAMSSFFTVPASQRKRKREDRAAAPASKKRGVDAQTDGADRRARERDESISGSDLDEDEDNLDLEESGEESASDSDDGETAADRRLKLAERYLDNVREEVDEVGFDAAQIDRDLIAERLKQDVVCFCSFSKKRKIKKFEPLTDGD